VKLERQPRVKKGTNENVSMEMIVTEEQLKSKLQSHQLRPTQQRLKLGSLLFSKGNRHFTAEDLYSEALAENISVSLATIYNTLNQFAGVGLLKEVQVDKNRCYFDTNITEHFHIYRPATGEIWDASSEAVKADIDMEKLDIKGTIEGIDIIIRIS
jgi:Fur family transcriptional regulator, iron response regulator